MDDLQRRVNLDHKAKIAWVMLGNMPLASFAFEAWGGANKAAMAAHEYMSGSDVTDKEKIDALSAEVERLQAALRVYADPCDATNTTPCGYEGNMCCMTAREALGAMKGKP